MEIGLNFRSFLLTFVNYFQGAKKDPKAGSKAPAKAPKKKEGGGGGKAKKKKWSKGKTRDKLNNLVLFDKPTYDKLLKEVPTYKLITPSIVSERLKVRGSLARKALLELCQKGENKIVKFGGCFRECKLLLRKFDFT